MNYKIIRFSPTKDVNALSDKLDLLKQVAHGLAVQYGSSTEVVIHDLTDRDGEPVVAYIENGYITHRSAGDGPSPVGLAARKKSREQLPELDYLVFSSAGGVELFYDTVGPVPEGPVCVCIGPVTAAALEKRLDRPFLTSPDISAGGIVETILAAERAKTEDR